MPDNFDRTAFKMTKDASGNFTSWKSQSLKERLRASNYLNSVACNYPQDGPAKPGRMDFKMGHNFNEDLKFREKQ